VSSGRRREKVKIFFPVSLSFDVVGAKPMQATS
jgi:hypothetical protein